MNKTESKTKRLTALARNMPMWDDFIIEEFKKDPEFMRGAVEDELQEYAQSGDIRYLLSTLRDVAATKGWVWLANETGLSRPTLYEALHGRSKPKFETVTKILGALGFKMFFVAVDNIKPQPVNPAKTRRITTRTCEIEAREA
ncbi:MAG: putative addiction module antidote protein [Synergistaceae bacterium]|nr:putative addiction module antidote protein [Synergistaceae bacterium]